MTIAVSYTSPELQVAAKRLSVQLGVAILGDNESLLNNDNLDNSDTRKFILELTPQRLQLKMHGAQKLNPIYVDFLHGKAAHRRLYGGGKGQLIAKACAIKSAYRPIVIDATAGLGRDAFTLACLGCKVLMLERSPIIAALLEDGLQRLRQDQELAQTIDLQLKIVDALDYLKLLEGGSVLSEGEDGSDNEDPFAFSDVIFIDPMYPARQQTALAKKEMRILAELLGQDQDIQPLLQVAKKCAKKRVVIKRPRLLPQIVEEKPDIVYQGRSTRFDVYQTSIYKAENDL